MSIVNDINFFTPQGHAETLGKQIYAFLEQLFNFRSVNNANKKVELNNYESALGALFVALDIKKPIREVLEFLPVSKSEFDETALLNFFANFDYSPKKATLKFNEIDSRLLPCLILPDPKTNTGAKILFSNNISLALNDDTSSITEIGYNRLVYDCTTHEITKADINDRSLVNVCFFVRSEILSKAVKRNRSNKFWFINIVSRFKKTFAQILAASFVLNLIAVATPLFIMTVYDKVISSNLTYVLKPLLIAALIAVVVEFVLRYLRLKTLAWFGGRLDFLISTSIFEKLLKLAPTYTERASVSSQISRLRSFEAIRDFFTGNLFPTMVELPFAFVILLAIFFISPTLSAVALCASLLFALLFFLIRPIVIRHIAESSSTSALKNEYNIETYEKMHSLRCSGVTSMWFRNFRTLSGNASNAIYRSVFTSSIIETISYAIYIFAGLMVLLFGISLVRAGSLTSGGLIASMLLTWRFLLPFNVITSSVPRIIQFRNTIMQIDKLHQMKTENLVEGQMIKLNSIEGNIKFSSVGLRYIKEHEPVFSGLSFSVPAGSLAAVSGANGSGKSTVLKLINAIYQPQAGLISIDGINIKQISPLELRRHITYVSQSPNIFFGTIAENLRHANPFATDEQLIDVLKKLKIYEQVSKLPDGINHIISENDPGAIPNGLIYKLNIAKAFLRDNKIILFDELPYSILNSPTGEVFKTTLQEWRGKKTVLFVTHRQDYIKMADIHIQLDSNQRPIITNLHTSEEQ